MYLLDMGSVELLSREGEIAIAKRIEAGREAMIAGLCESPLTFQAIIIWRDELNEGKIFLGDIIDLEATYTGPDAKGMSAAGAPGEDGAVVPGAPAQPPQMAAPATAPAAPTPFVTKRDEVDREAAGEPPTGEGEMDDDDLENSRDPVDLADVAARMAESLVDLILLAPDEQRGSMLAETIFNLGHAFLEKTDELASESDTTH